MFVHDFGVWLYCSGLNSKGASEKRHIKVEDFDFSSLKKWSTVQVWLNGKRICNLRESSANYIWIEQIHGLASQISSTSAHINARGKTRKTDLKKKLNQAIENLKVIQLAIDKMED